MAIKGTRRLPPGIYAPIPTFFQPETEDLDLPSFQSHVVYVAQAGVGPLICGSMGEAHHLTPDERITLIKSARQALDEAGLKDVPLVVGTGVGSLRESIKLTKDAAEAGADYAIVIASGYYAGSLSNNEEALYGFWKEIADASPIPIIIYNCGSFSSRVLVWYSNIHPFLDPGAAGGIDLSSDLIISLAEHPNIVGTKLTCGNVGKLTRISTTTNSPSFLQSHPRIDPDLVPEFLVLGGFTDFVVPSAFVDAHGAITGLANVFPYSSAKLFKLTERLKKQIRDPAAGGIDRGLLDEVIRLQGVVAQADRTFALAGIGGTKATLQKLHGWGGKPRKPLPAYSEAETEKLLAHPTAKALFLEEEEAKAEAHHN
jgi:4-hydroxy-2-oxoglutarate aldolase